MLKNSSAQLESRPLCPRHISARFASAAFSLCLLFGSAGCIHDATVGPLFARSPTPDANISRVYVYRIDPHHSYSMVEIELDHERTIHLLDEEYLGLDLEAGVHEFSFRFRRRFGLPGSSWQTQRIRAKGGETNYFEIAVSVTDRGTMAARESDIAGRNPSGTAGEVVSMRAKNEREASERIRMTHLHVP